MSTRQHRHLRKAPVLISWGRPQGSGLSAMVVSTKAHLWDESTWQEWSNGEHSAPKTLCGVDVPVGVLPGNPVRPTVFSRVYRDGPSETARQPKCKRCEAVLARLSSNVTADGRPIDGGA